MAYLSTIDFFEDRSFLDRWKAAMKGDLDLSWMKAATEQIECRPQNPRRGLTFRDLDVGSYGFSELPEVVRKNRTFAPRGDEGRSRSVVDEGGHRADRVPAAESAPRA